MHEEILAPEQKKLLPLVALFKKDFGLVGGTAIALHIGHRESLDFDLFSLEEFDNLKIRNKIKKLEKIDEVARDEIGQFTLKIHNVKFTFLHYPFPIIFSENFGDVIVMPDLLMLAAMKAYALGRRQKWKDYVDLYFIIKDFHPIKEVMEKAKDIFKNEFNERLFREQISYFEDMDYSEEIVWMKGFEISKEVIKKALIEFSLL